MLLLSKLRRPSEAISFLGKMRNVVFVKKAYSGLIDLSGGKTGFVEHTRVFPSFRDNENPPNGAKQARHVSLVYTYRVSIFNGPPLMLGTRQVSIYSLKFKREISPYFYPNVNITPCTKLSS